MIQEISQIPDSFNFLNEDLLYKFDPKSITIYRIKDGKQINYAIKNTQEILIVNNQLIIQTNQGIYFAKLRCNHIQVLKYQKQLFAKGCIIADKFVVIDSDRISLYTQKYSQKLIVNFKKESTPQWLQNQIPRAINHKLQLYNIWYKLAMKIKFKILDYFGEPNNLFGDLQRINDFYIASNEFSSDCYYCDLDFLETGHGLIGKLKSPVFCISKLDKRIFIIYKEVVKYNLFELRGTELKLIKQFEADSISLQKDQLIVDNKLYKIGQNIIEQ